MDRVRNARRDLKTTSCIKEGAKSPPVTPSPGEGSTSKSVVAESQSWDYQLLPKGLAGHPVGR